MRWQFTKDNMEWFQDQKRVVQNYDTNYGAEARHEDGPYGHRHMDNTKLKVKRTLGGNLVPIGKSVLRCSKHKVCNFIFGSTLYNMLNQKARKKDVTFLTDEGTVIIAPELITEDHVAHQQLENACILCQPIFLVFIGLPLYLLLGLTTSVS